MLLSCVATKELVLPNRGRVALRQSHLVDIHDWHAAQAADSLESYRVYLAQHGDGAYRGYAQARVDWYDDSVWAAIGPASSAMQLTSYQKLFPEGRHYEQARTALDLLDWQQAVQAGTMEAYNYYIDLHPRGEKASAARECIEKIVENGTWEQACAAGTRQAYADFVRDFPESGHAGLARLRITGFDWASMTAPNKIVGTVLSATFQAEMTLEAPGGGIRTTDNIGDWEFGLVLAEDPSRVYTATPQDARRFGLVTSKGGPYGTEDMEVACEGWRVGIVYEKTGQRYRVIWAARLE
jgi:hypothetical protein